MPGTSRNLDHLRAPEWVSVEEFANLTGYAQATIYDHVRDGKIAALPRGKGDLIRIPTAEIARTNGTQEAS